MSENKTLRLVNSDAALTERVPPKPAPASTTLASADTIATNQATSDPGVVRDLEAELASHDPSKRYEHGVLLGEGGMGEVRLCRDKHIARDVAMKVMRKSAEAHADLHARFLREARVQGQLEHPAIVPVYDLGRDSTGSAYFTMRRIRGETLEQIIEKLRALDEAGKSNSDVDDTSDYALHKLLAVFLRVCLAVDYAHKKGVVHRDLKPGNIMIGSYGEVYVLDWGLAKVMSREEQAAADEADPVSVSSSGISATEVGQVMGTPGYMAPEQILGQTAEVGARADIYALGSILFEILAHEPLCGHGSATDVLMRAVRGIDARASVRAKDRNVPPELDDVCVRATMASARERFATARELHDAVDRYVSGDRDMARRREMAKEHADRGKELTRSAIATSSEDDRKNALAALGRAIALDPKNPTALATMIELLTAPPKVVPQEVKDRILENDRESRRNAFLVAGILFLVVSFLVWVPFGVAMGGFRNWSNGIAADVAWVLVAGICFHFYRRPRDTHLPVLAIAASIAAALTSFLFGPLVVVPTLAVGLTVSFVVSGQKEHRFFGIACGVLAVMVPYLLEVFHVMPPSLRVENGVVEILPRSFHYDPTWTPIFLLVSQVSTIIVSGFFVGRYRDAFVAAERRIQMQAWQLRLLVPDEAQSAFASNAPGPRLPELCLHDKLVQHISKKST